MSEMFSYLALAVVVQQGVPNLILTYSIFFLLEKLLKIILDILTQTPIIHQHNFLHSCLQIERVQGKILMDKEQLNNLRYFNINPIDSPAELFTFFFRRLKTSLGSNKLRLQF